MSYYRGERFDDDEYDTPPVRDSNRRGPPPGGPPRRSTPRREPEVRFRPERKNAKFEEANDEDDGVPIEIYEGRRSSQKRKEEFTRSTSNSRRRWEEEEAEREELYVPNRSPKRRFQYENGDWDDRKRVFYSTSSSVQKREASGNRRMSAVGENKRYDDDEDDDGVEKYHRGDGSVRRRPPPKQERMPAEEWSDEEEDWQGEGQRIVVGGRKKGKSRYSREEYDGNAATLKQALRALMETQRNATELLQLAKERVTVSLQRQREQHEVAPVTVHIVHHYTKDPPPQSDGQVVDVVVKQLGLPPQNQQSVITQEILNATTQSAPAPQITQSATEQHLVNTPQQAPSSAPPPPSQSTNLSIADAARKYNVTVEVVRQHNPELAQYSSQQPLPVNTPIRVPVQSSSSSTPQAQSTTVTHSQQQVTAPQQAPAASRSSSASGSDVVLVGARVSSLPKPPMSKPKMNR